MIRFRNIRITDHEFVNFPRDKLKQELQNLKDGLYEFIIRKWKVKRTLQQNSLYHVCYCKQLGEYLGYTSAEMHAIYKYEILKPNFEAMFVNRNVTTTILSKCEFSVYIDHIEQWAWHEHQFTFDKSKAENEIEDKQLSIT